MTPFKDRTLSGVFVQLSARLDHSLNYYFHLFQSYKFLRRKTRLTRFNCFFNRLWLGRVKIVIESVSNGCLSDGFLLLKDWMLPKTKAAIIDCLFFWAVVARKFFFGLYVNQQMKRKAKVCGLLSSTVARRICWQSFSIFPLFNGAATFTFEFNIMFFHSLHNWL